MNQLIREQLSNVTSTTIEYDGSSNYIFIPKTTRILFSALKVGECYTVDINNHTCVVEILDKNSNSVKLNGVIVDEKEVKDLYGWYDKDDICILGRS